MISIDELIELYSERTKLKYNTVMVVRGRPSEELASKAFVRDKMVLEALKYAKKCGFDFSKES